MFIPAILNNPVVEKYNELIEKYKELKTQILDNELVQQFLYALATVLGVVVGVSVWVANRVRQWYNNGGKVWMLSVSKRVLYFISNRAEQLYYQVADSLLAEIVDVPEVKVAQ